MLRMSGLASARVSRPFDIGVLHNHSRTAFDVPYPTPKSRETETGEAQICVVPFNRCHASQYTVRGCETTDKCSSIAIVSN